MNKITRIGAYAVIQQDKEVLLCQLTRSRLWTLPGGGIEFGESPEEAVIREVKEETGYNIKVSELLGVNSFVKANIDEVHFIQIIYKAQIISGQMKSEIDGTTDLCEWHSWDKVAVLDTTPAIPYVLASRASI